MNNQILITLKRKLDKLVDEHGEIGVEIQRNALKEELQFYVLNFIYHHPEYSNWTMYGGSALRICHGLDRMSVDLDFEVAHPVSEKFLNKLKEEIELYFLNTYNVDSKLLTVKKVGTRGLRLNFHIGNKFGIDHPSKQVHVKIDLHRFTAPKTVTEKRPTNEHQLSFIIKAYNMSALMASKIAAVFLREEFIIGSKKYNYKGRDIYDLLWYMKKGIVPDFDYLIAKGIEVSDPKTLFNKITLEVLNYEKMNDCLKDDLLYLFKDQAYIENWIKNWRDSYMRLLEKYEIYAITTLEPPVHIYQDFLTDVFSFVYQYNTEDGKSVGIIYKLSGYWIDFRDGDLSINIDKKINDAVEFSSSGISSRSAPQDKLKQYATLFYQKTESYLKKTNHVMLGNTIETKLIRMTADNLNQKEQILLNKSALQDCELDDLLK
ncbi:MAG: nucleotidyl transferase AbiEii/AbiGii toxin family protein [Patescibacteria group bacterium]